MLCTMYMFTSVFLIDLMRENLILENSFLKRKKNCMFRELIVVLKKIAVLCGESFHESFERIRLLYST